MKDPGSTSGVCHRLKGSKEMRWRIEPTVIDERVSAALAACARPELEYPTKLLTLAGDERVLLSAAAGLWLASKASGAYRREATHLLANVLTTAILPHLMKHLIDQERPDRRMTHGR